MFGYGVQIVWVVVAVGSSWTSNRGMKASNEEQGAQFPMPEYLLLQVAENHVRGRPIFVSFCRRSYSCGLCILQDEVLMMQLMCNPNGSRQCVVVSADEVVLTRGDGEVEDYSD